MHPCILGWEVTTCTFAAVTRTNPGDVAPPPRPEEPSVPSLLPSLPDIRRGCFSGSHVHFTVFTIALRCLFLIHVPAEGMRGLPSASEASKTTRHGLDWYAWSAVTMKKRAIRSNTGPVVRKVASPLVILVY